MGIVGEIVGNLEIGRFINLASDKINFFVANPADVYRIAVTKKVQVDDIF